MDGASVIGPTTVIRGGIRGDGDLEILGRVEGTVHVQGEVTIGETALLQSDVRARRVIVRGAVRGNVSADELLILEAGARVLGDLGAPQVGIRPGGLVKGHVSTAGPLPLERPKAAPAAAAKAAPARAVTPAARPAPAPARPAPAAARPAPAPAARPAAPVRQPVAHTEEEVVTPAPRPSASRAASDSSSRAASDSSSRAASDSSSRAASDSSSRAVAAPPPAPEPEVEAAAEPPPPVVPAMPKGARASVRKKGAK